MTDRSHRPGMIGALLVVAAAACVMRVWLPADRVFRDGYVDFHNDASYHMRVVEHLVANFPHRLTWDPYAAPDGQYVAVAPLFDYLIATVALIAGGGSPSAATIECAGALVAPALGTLGVLIAFLLGRRLFDARAGLLAAAVLAVMPGPYLERTLAGYADHHAAEAALVLLTLLSVVAALQRGERHPDAAMWRVPAAWVAGLCLGAYCLTWTSAALFVSALGLWAALQLVVDDRLDRPSAPTSSLAMIAGTTALAVVLVFQDPQLFRFASQVAALGGLALLGGIALMGEHLRARFPRFGPTPIVLIAATAAFAAAIAGMLFPGFVGGVLQDALRLEPNPAGRLVEEAQPLMTRFGRFSWLNPWHAFGPAFYVGVAALAALAIEVRRDGAREHALLLVWSAVSAVAALGQIRFGYYLAPMLALLVGWTCSSFWSWSSSRRSRIAALSATALILVTSAWMGVLLAAGDRGSTDGMRRALLWLKDHTPEPFGDAAYYLASYRETTRRKATYSVMTWLDDGYEVVRVARRVPAANPTQEGAAAFAAARFFTSTREAEAREILEASGSRYVLLNRDLVFLRTDIPALLFGKFDGLASWAGEAPARFVEGMFERGDDGELKPVWVFYPDYYRSMTVRLYLYAGLAARPDNSTWVITYADRNTAEGAFREIVTSTRFATYEEGAAALKALGDGPHRLVGRLPLRTAVPLEPLQSFSPIHDEHDEGSPLPAARVFRVQ